MYGKLLPAMKLKLDENISRHLKPILENLSHDVLTVSDQGLLSQDDITIGMAAKTEGRMLLTLDLEFGDLRKHPPGEHPGIILFRPRSFGPLFVNRFVEDFVRETDLETLRGCVVLVDTSKVRVRPPPTNIEQNGIPE
jgi:predicted nuclease of predicted toxin-antitoxin system